MKKKSTFVIINGNDLFIRLFESKDDAVMYCKNYMDQSKEIIVREINRTTVVSTDRLEELIDYNM